MTIIIENKKLCKKCKEKKDKSKFDRRPRSKDGLSATCDDCRNLDKDYQKRKWAWHTKSSHKNQMKRVVTITHQDLYDMACKTDCCYYCGCVLDWSPKKGQAQANSPSLDRIDPVQDMTKENCRIICLACNMGKGSGSEIDYIARCIHTAQKALGRPVSLGKHLSFKLIFDKIKCINGI